MSISRRSAVSLGVFAVLALFALGGFWYQFRHTAPGQPAADATVNVTNGDDRGPGSLREALFIAAAAERETTVAVQVPRITISTALPPLVSAHGMHLVAAVQGAEIDASGLPNGPVLDVAGANVSVEGLHIRNCRAAAILLRAERFRLQASTLEACDVGVEVAENAAQVLIENNHFISNRVGTRFAASNRNSSVVKNEFIAHRDAGVWAVRGEPDLRGEAISIRENRFTRERIGVIAANISIAIERNDLVSTRETAIQLFGTGAVVRGNRINGGSGMGIVAENSNGVVIEGNELEGLAAYGVMVKGSADALLKSNRVHNSGYGLAFVVGNARSPSTAIDNTIIEPKFNGIDVIGDSPILRGNHVLRPHALALKVIDFQSESGDKVRSQPFLEGNNFDARGLVVAADSSPATGAQR